MSSLRDAYDRRFFTRLRIPDASFHTLRHTTASWLVQQGVDLYAVGQILGRKTPRMTQRYAHLSPDYMASSVGKLDGIQRTFNEQRSRLTAEIDGLKADIRNTGVDEIGLEAVLAFAERIMSRPSRLWVESPPGTPATAAKDAFSGRNDIRWAAI